MRWLVCGVVLCVVAALLAPPLLHHLQGREGDNEGMEISGVNGQSSRDVPTMPSVERVSDVRSLRLSSIVTQRRPVVFNRVAAKWKAVGNRVTASWCFLIFPSPQRSGGISLICENVSQRGCAIGSTLIAPHSSVRYGKRTSPWGLRGSLCGRIPTRTSM